MNFQFRYFIFQLSVPFNSLSYLLFLLLFCSWFSLNLQHVCNKWFKLFSAIFIISVISAFISIIIFFPEEIRRYIGFAYLTIFWFWFLDIVNVVTEYWIVLNFSKRYLTFLLTSSHVHTSLILFRLVLGFVCVLIFYWGEGEGLM